MNMVPEEGNTDTEGGSLNSDLRIREKGTGNRTLPIERANEVCPMFLKKHYKFEEQSISKTTTKHCCY